MIEYSHSVQDVHCSTENTQLPMTVTSVLMKYHAVDTEHAVTATVTVLVSFDTPQSDTFVPFDSITEDILMSWVDQEPTGTAHAHYLLNSSLTSEREEKSKVSRKFSWMNKDSDLAVSTEPVSSEPIESTSTETTESTESVSSEPIESTSTESTSTESTETTESVSSDPPISES
jgi:hypothetical protein